MPVSWEERTALFCSYMIQNYSTQSSTIASYISAIKGTLRDDGYEWDDPKIMLHSLIRACKLQNDVLKCRLPIQKGLLELILFELRRLFHSQPYLETMYQAMFCMAYYGLMRVGELTQGEHPVKARDVHIGQNKDKILIVLYTSKTHDRSNFPQKIKIEAGHLQTGIMKKKYNFFCPFKAVRNYLTMRGPYTDINENFFVFTDKSVVSPKHMRDTLRNCLDNLNLDPSVYDTHSMRAGRSVDLRKMNFSVQFIKEAGRWSSNAVYKYLKT